jgi:hypothetical protein
MTIVVKTWTSEIRGAGTDANVFIQIIGSDQDTERLKLSNNKDNFEQGRVDEFTVILILINEIMQNYKL